MNYKTIFIICPANGNSGGPEALHQLSHVLSKKKQTNFLIYVDFKTLDIVDSKTPNKFKWYDFNLSNSINDDEDNLVIIPETMTKYLIKIKYAKKAIWWLSVDYGNWNEDFKDDRILHFCQSQYALDFISSKGANCYLLSDFVVTYKSIPFFVSKKKNIITYDPRKLNSHFNEVKTKLELKFTFKPIQDLDRIRLALLFAKSNFYFDLGYNPGKDRLPREAILYNTIPIISNLGSAINDLDFQIPNQSKLSLQTSPEKICKKIIAINEQSLNYLKLFTNFRIKVKDEKSIFNEEVNNIFGLNGKFKISFWEKIMLIVYDFKDLITKILKSVLIKLYKKLK